VLSVTGSRAIPRQEPSAILGRGTQPDEPGILSFMDRSLPSYAKPSGIEVMESFPRTTTGKIDRKKLAARAVE